MRLGLRSFNVQKEGCKAGENQIFFATTHTEARDPADFQQILMVAPDGYIANLACCDVLLKLVGFGGRG
jgi:hypothetical protein